MKNLFFNLFVVLTAISLVGCSAKRSNRDAKRAEVKLLSKSGSRVKGSLALEDHYGGVNITGKISGLKPNSVHGIHVHAKGDCSGRGAEAAGDHFAVEGQEHGASGSSHSHAGDLGNITADKDGNAELNIHAKGLSLKSGEKSIAGLSLVVHADADDLKTQPAGNSGKRIACGVVQVLRDQCCGSSQCCGKCDSGPNAKDCKDCKKGKKS